MTYTELIRKVAALPREKQSEVVDFVELLLQMGSTLWDTFTGSAPYKETL